MHTRAGLIGGSAARVTPIIGRTAPLLTPMDAAPRSFLDRPLTSLSAWVTHFCAQDIPILSTSVEALECLRAAEDEVDAHLVGETFSIDPLMTLKVLVATAQLGRERRNADAETVTSAVVLMGITPFFATFGLQPSVEQWLLGHPEALEGVEAVLRRSERAARYALAFAAHRMDQDAQIIHSAALLHDFAEVLLWCHAPTLAQEIRRLQSADPSLRSVKAQRQVLGIELSALEQALMKAWHLPPLLTHITDERCEADAQVQCVRLAVRLARHSAKSWDNPAIPDDLKEISALLNLGTEPTKRLVMDLG